MPALGEKTYIYSMKALRHRTGSWIMAFALSIVLAHAFTPHDHFLPSTHEAAFCDQHNQPLKLFGFDAGLDHLSHFRTTDSQRDIRFEQVAVVSQTVIQLSLTEQHTPWAIFPPPPLPCSYFQPDAPGRRGPPRLG
jgi:hypothetical protein